MKNLLLIFCFLFGVRVWASDGWNISVSELDANNYYGVTLGNGQLGLVTSPNPLKVSRIVLGGVYDIYGRGRVSNFIQGINMLDVDLKIDGEPVTFGAVSDYSQNLDMFDGLFSGRFDYSDKASVVYTYTALRHLPYSCILKVTIEPRKDICLNVENTIRVHESLRNPSEYFTTVKNGMDSYNVMTTTAYTPTCKLELGASSVLLLDASYDLPAISHLSTKGVGMHSQMFDIKLKAGKPYSFFVLGATVSSEMNADVRNELERLAYFMAVEGADRLLDKHCRTWNRLWNSDIEIFGDVDSQRDVHNMLFHIYGSLRENSRWSVSPMGLSGFGYNGHVFWDAETWVFPVVLLLHPEMAKSMLDYRYDRLDAAKYNAYLHGYRGAKYPWESSSSGFEEIPAHNLYGNFEDHITADVAIAAWQYYQVTQDRLWLKEKGFPMIKECADFGVSRVDYDGNCFSLINVIGADEWNVNQRGGKNVDNNAYTIGAVKTNLTIAIRAATLLGEPVDSMWGKVADGLKLPTFPNRIIKVHQTYADGMKTKQADVSLLSYPLNIVKDSCAIRSNLEYYISTVPRKNTPAMSKSVYSVLYSYLGDWRNAWAYFEDSYEPNMLPPFGVIAEFDGGTNPYFITGAGGALQAVMMGFGGLRITDDGVKIENPSVPPCWTGLTLKGIGAQKRTFKIK